MATFDDTLLDALSVPIGDLIASVGQGVADAQRAMDLASIDALLEIYGSADGPHRELQQIGYRPTWYHIPQAEGEIQVALTVAGQSPAASSPARARGSKLSLYAAPVDAGYTSRFNYTLQAASKVTFRIVPIPPSTAAESMRVVPSLVGLTIAEARRRLERLGIDADVGSAADTKVITAQDPAAGSILEPGTAVKIKTA